MVKTDTKTVTEMRGAIVLTNQNGFELVFNSDESEGLISCCELVKCNLEFLDEQDASLRVAATIPFDPSINCEIVKECFDYLRRHNFNPIQAKKVVSSKLEDHFSDIEDLNLAKKYADPTKCLELRDVAAYLRIPNVINICNLLTAMYILVDVSHPDGYQHKLKELGITEEYTWQTEKLLLQKYPFLNTQ